MPDWATIEIADFDALCKEDGRLDVLVGRAVLFRLPFTFESKKQYLTWRDRLAADLDLDGNDIHLVGSAATGRSLSARKQFKTFDKRSDVDIAVVSPAHFDRAWTWFRRTNVDLLSGLDERGRELFHKHRSHYIYDGIVATDYFLSYLPFGNEWLSALQRSEEFLPSTLAGRQLRVRIYRDASALREAQMEALVLYRKYLGI